MFLDWRCALKIVSRSVGISKSFWTSGRAVTKPSLWEAAAFLDWPDCLLRIVALEISNVSGLVGVSKELSLIGNQWSFWQLLHYPPLAQDQEGLIRSEGDSNLFMTSV